MLNQTESVADIQWRLQRTLLFAVLVAGKTESFARNVTRRLVNPTQLPFQTIEDLIVNGGLEATLRAVRSGNYTRLIRCFPEMVKLDPATCTLDELETVPGIGPKTARAFLLWTRPESRFAALDTHILKYLRHLGYQAPKSTPTGAKYRELEIAFLARADDLGMSPADLDTQVWEHYARGAGVPLP